jgi:alginate O-acetyltransferase complex protein AlgI
MFFNSFIFFIFMAIVLPVFYLLPRKYKVPHLLIASYIFYGYWDWRFCSLLAISTIVDFFVGKVLHGTENQRSRKQLLLVSMIVNLGILGFFKYFNFFIGSIQATAASMGLGVDFLHLNIILPVGISFYTFQTMSYTIDIYKKKLEPTQSFMDFALFVSFFPQLVAGPIERARNLLPQIAVMKNPSRAQFNEGVILFVTGMFKKVMIGDTTGRIVDQIFGQPELYKSPELLMGLVLFSVQIYADFSGYSSIARGLAKMLGIDLMVNFKQPYLSANITEFWRRWHISLSSWLADYLYIAMGGNRKGLLKTYRNLIITMLLGGLWHGASWNFVVWGALHGLYLAVHKFALRGKKVSTRYEYAGPGNLARYLVNLAFTNLIVLFAWLFFRAKTFDDAWYFLVNIFNWQGSELTPRLVTITLTFLVAVLAFDIPQYKLNDQAFLMRIKSPAALAGICLAMILSFILYMATATPLPFVYFQF